MLPAGTMIGRKYAMTSRNETTLTAAMKINIILIIPNKLLRFLYFKIGQQG
jgi:hypothetical protein